MARGARFGTRRARGCGAHDRDTPSEIHWGWGRLVTELGRRVFRAKSARQVLLPGVGNKLPGRGRRVPRPSLPGAAPSARASRASLVGPRCAPTPPRALAQALPAPAALRLPAPGLRDPARRPAPGLGPRAASASPPLARVPAMRPRAAPRAPAGAGAALGLCSLLLLLPPGPACPAGCACTDPHTVDCRDRGLPSVPDPFPLDVRKLLVAGNRIQHIPEGFFIFYGDLVYLDFRNNSLRSLEEGTFSGSAKLAFLDLSYNNLTQLGAGAFRSAGRLVKLSLANNNLAGVHEAAFETLESLQVLELNDNNLRSLNVAALAALPALRTLRLDGNPWLCDCDFAHLFSWIQENVSKLPKGLDEIQCSLPMENRRILLQELSEASFSECKFSLSLTDLFIIIFSGVAVSIAAIISSFFLATVVQCFQRCAPNKDTEDEDEDEDD
ncbi:PREDICTED: leucine-rich repeat-containing protein 38 [Lipotes vexillifer]|uniref:Leucine-rich repeat-containing protein 38 n=1 Tax=Lipotes vexillifer TaxID=118797 RepID=A0A340XSU3_LIPVE|nr:PREDICTED: leucine-rich repeat-containing protein 38 [Lipotes vexillifer]